MSDYETEVDLFQEEDQTERRRLNQEGGIGEEEGDTSRVGEGEEGSSEEEVIDLAISRSQKELRAEETARKQKRVMLMDSLHFDTIAICEASEKSITNGLKIDPAVAYCLSRSVYNLLASVASDISLFAKHAGRSTVNVDDVLLTVRKNPSLQHRLNAFMQENKITSPLESKQKNSKKRKQVTSSSTSLANKKKQSFSSNMKQSRLQPIRSKPAVSSSSSKRKSSSNSCSPSKKAKQSEVVDLADDDDEEENEEGPQDKSEEEEDDDDDGNGRDKNIYSDSDDDFVMKS